MVILSHNSNMYKFKSLFLGLFTLFFSTIFFVSCDDSTSSAYTGVRMIDNTFSPPVVRVHEGGIVRFYNAGNNPHNVVATDESWGDYEDCLLYTSPSPRDY